MPRHPTRFDAFGNKFLDYYAPHDVYHPGVDYNYGKPANADLGQEIVACADGFVVYVSPPGDNGGLGQYLVMSHPDYGASGVWTRHLHLQAVLVSAGQFVKEGERIALLGDSGTATAHDHFEVMNERGLAFIRDYKVPYGRYPSGLSRAAVASMWLDPVRWVETAVPVVPAWQIEARKWAMDNKVISSGWDRPLEPMSQARVAAALKNLHDLLKKGA